MVIALGVMLGVVFSLFLPWINNYKFSAFKRDFLAHPVFMGLIVASYLSVTFMLSTGLVKTLFVEFGS